MQSKMLEIGLFKGHVYSPVFFYLFLLQSYVFSLNLTLFFDVNVRGVTFKVESSINTFNLKVHHKIKFPLDLPNEKTFIYTHAYSGLHAGPGI